MKNFVLVLVVSTVLLSCKKELNDNRQLLVGKWNWKSSLHYNGTQMMPINSSITDSNFVVFSNDKFANNAFCVIGGSNQGYYELNKASNKQILILKSPNSRPDTFYVNITNTQIDLTEVYSNYSWTHTFIKRDNSQTK